MANRARKTEHSGAKHGNGAYWGPKVEAKHESNKLRRERDRQTATPILDVKHGEVGGSDDLGCEPDCVPDKGVHVLRSSLYSHRGSRPSPSVTVEHRP